MMGKTRLEAFSDAVIAILMTIMVLELKAPIGHDLSALRPLVPTFLAYVLSFLYLGIYWNNHHHLVHTVRRVTGGVLWANMNLLFWLSLVPFTTSWLGEHPSEVVPTAVYSFSLLMPGLSYWLLQIAIIRGDGPDSILARALGSDFKGKSSPPIYVVAVALSFVSPALAQTLLVAVALMWLVPDRRIEREIRDEQL